MKGRKRRRPARQAAQYVPPSVAGADLQREQFFMTAHHKSDARCQPHAGESYGDLTVPHRYPLSVSCQKCHTDSCRLYSCVHTLPWYSVVALKQQHGDDHGQNPAIPSCAELHGLPRSQSSQQLGSNTASPGNIGLQDRNPPLSRDHVPLRPLADRRHASPDVGGHDSRGRPKSHHVAEG